MAADLRRLPVNGSKTATGATKVDDSIEIRRLFMKASESRARVDLLFPQSKKRFVTRVCVDWDGSDRLRFELPAEEKPDDIVEEAQISGECNAIIFLRGQVLVCVRSSLAAVEKDAIALREPWSVFLIQRRIEPRYEIPKAYEYHVTIESLEGPRRRVQKRLIDLSASGMGVQILSSREAGIFRVGLILKRISFRIDGHLITVDAQVCNCVPLDKNSGFSGSKVGFKFLRISRDDKMELATWVARQISLS